MIMFFGLLLFIALVVIVLVFSFKMTGCLIERLDKAKTWKQLVDEKLVGCTKIGHLQGQIDALKNSLASQCNDCHQQEIREELSRLREKVNELEKNVEHLSSQEHALAQETLQKVELKNDQLPDSELTATQAEADASSVDTVRHLIFADTVNGLFLLNGSDVRKEKSLVEIDEISEGVGEFDILDFGFVRQSNGLDKIIKYEPNCVGLQDAEYVETIQKGKCIKDSNVWKVTEPVRIKIMKR